MVELALELVWGLGLGSWQTTWGPTYLGELAFC